jgi:nicotinate-nucleotide adenylyltransferase
MGRARRIGIFGGTFDPIHCGHIDLARAAEAALGLSRVLLMPTNVPPHRPQPLASAHHRFAMVSFAVARHATWRVSDLELRAGAPSFTSATLAKFHERGYAPAELFFLIGADAFMEIGTWKDYPQILDRAHFAVVSRPGWPVADLPQRLPQLASRMAPPPMDPLDQLDATIVLIDAATANVSSTAIRERRAGGRSIAGLVESAAGQHIEQHGLYTPMVPGRRRNDPPPAGSADRLHGER